VNFLLISLLKKWVGEKSMGLREFRSKSLTHDQEDFLHTSFSLISLPRKRIEGKSIEQTSSDKLFRGRKRREKAL